MEKLKNSIVTAIKVVSKSVTALTTIIVYRITYTRKKKGGN